MTGWVAEQASLCSEYNWKTSFDFKKNVDPEEHGERETRLAEEVNTVVWKMAGTLGDWNLDYKKFQGLYQGYFQLFESI